MGVGWKLLALSAGEERLQTRKGLQWRFGFGFFGDVDRAHHPGRIDFRFLSRFPGPDFLFDPGLFLKLLSFVLLLFLPREVYFLPLVGAIHAVDGTQQENDDDEVSEERPVGAGRDLHEGDRRHGWRFLRAGFDGLGGRLDRGRWRGRWRGMR